ncbi:hypothetical protein [Deinococcus enclensis]|uniref:Uncharacterized protein n=1 Tax=Deinococcus enclensis TaxID=1049582 RepID=A0ABT9MBA3_9DEIO|nr:hypothetical protein [Deinococcus enclensis]MDP9763857.1 hypothetical protein [Deinococcus enclensis]
MTLTRHEVTMPKAPPQPAIVVTAPNAEAAQRQYWRHVANRACLAILADQRHPVLTARQGRTDPTRGPNHPPRPIIGGDVFQVRAEPIQINDTVTDWLSFDLLVQPTRPGNILTLAVLRDWPAPTTTEPLFKYRNHLNTFERRTGLSGDMVYLFEMLLWPHAQEMLDAMTG